MLLGSFTSSAMSVRKCAESLLSCFESQFPLPTVSTVFFDLFYFASFESGSDRRKIRFRGRGEVHLFTVSFDASTSSPPFQAQIVTEHWHSTEAIKQIRTRSSCARLATTILNRNNML